MGCDVAEDLLRVVEWVDEELRELVEGREGEKPRLRKVFGA